MTDLKKNTEVRLVQQVPSICLFVSRLKAELCTAVYPNYSSQLVIDKCAISKLTTKYPRYPSFFVNCELKSKKPS